MERSKSKNVMKHYRAIVSANLKETYFLALLTCIMIGSAGCGAQEKDFFRLPLGLSEKEMVIPADNPLTREKIALGKQLFWDKRWSKGKTVSCASCHLPEHGWSDSRALSNRYDGKPTARHSPTIINRVFGELQQWTGARTSLEDQVRKASDSSPETVIENLSSIRAYDQQFRNVFGTGVTAEGVAKAIAAYERMILSGNSAYDRFQAGDNTAMSEAAQRGMGLFNGKARCAICHRGFNFTDEAFHNIGVGFDKPNPDLGRYPLTKIEANKGAFKTPTLRDAALRPPYMHDGSQPSFKQVVEMYNRGGFLNPWLSKDIIRLNLTDDEQDDLIAFLYSLTGEISPEITSPPQLPDDEPTVPTTNLPTTEGSLSRLDTTNGAPKW